MDNYHRIKGHKNFPLEQAERYYKIVNWLWKMEMKERERMERVVDYYRPTVNINFTQRKGWGKRVKVIFNSLVP